MLPNNAKNPQDKSFGKLMSNRNRLEGWCIEKIKLLTCVDFFCLRKKLSLGKQVWAKHIMVSNFSFVNQSTLDINSTRFKIHSRVFFFFSSFIPCWSTLFSFLSFRAAMQRVLVNHSDQHSSRSLMCQKTMSHKKVWQSMLWEAFLWEFDATKNSLFHAKTTKPSDTKKSVRFHNQLY